MSSLKDCDIRDNQMLAMFGKLRVLMHWDSKPGKENGDFKWEVLADQAEVWQTARPAQEMDPLHTARCDNCVSPQRTLKSVRATDESRVVKRTAAESHGQVNVQACYDLCPAPVQSNRVLVMHNSL